MTQRPSEVIDVDALTTAAAASVDGYLRNVSRRLRVPGAEGGRGTRRKQDIVVSADAVLLQNRREGEGEPAAPLEGAAGHDAGSSARCEDEDGERTLPLACDSVVVKQQVVDDSGEEWDVLEFPSTLDPKVNVVTTMKAPDESPPPTLSATDHLNLKPEAGKLKHEADAGAKPLEVVTKREELDVDDPYHQAAILSDMIGTRPTLTSMSNSSALHPSDRTRVVAEMLEEREAAKAQAKHDRIVRVAERVCRLECLIARGIGVMRESHHPVLLKRLLRLVQPGTRRRNPRNATETGTSDEGHSGRRAQNRGAAQRPSRPLLEALQMARAAFQALQALPTAPSHAPGWVTCKRDTVQNATSQAIYIVLGALSKMFRLTPAAGPTAAAPNSGGGGEEAPPEVGSNSLGFQNPFEEWKRNGFASLLQPQGELPPPCTTTTAAADASSVPRLVPTPIYLCVAFLALARAAGMCARLVLAWNPPKVNREEQQQQQQAGGGGGGAPSASASKGPLLTTFAPKVPKSKQPPVAQRGKQAQVSAKPNGASTGNGTDVFTSTTTTTPSTNAAAPAAPPPPVYCWCEVWCPLRRSFLSVNPCDGSTVMWSPVFALAFEGDGTVTDVTPRYTNKFSSCLLHRTQLEEGLSLHYIWSRVPKDDLRSMLEHVLSTRGPQTTASAERREREAVQLDKLRYAEPVPITLTALKGHPLYVVEEALGRWEAVYPKDKSTVVGHVKGLAVYRSSAVVSLRSRDGWLRERRSLASANEVPYKVVPPPPSRPFGNPSHFFGRWQTVPFAPLPLRADGTIEKHGNSSWYILLKGSPCPDGIVHVQRPQISRVARKIHTDYALAVVGFVKEHGAANRRGKWNAVIDGIVVPAVKAQELLRAYDEWVRLTDEEAANRRRQRALKWWAHLIRQRLALDRLQQEYAEGNTLRNRKRARGSLNESDNS